MYIAPENMFQLQRRDYLTGVRQQQAQRGKFLGRKVNHRLAAPQRAIRLQAEAGKGDRPYFAAAAQSHRGDANISAAAAKSCLRRTRISTAAVDTPSRGRFLTWCCARPNGVLLSLPTGFLESWATGLPSTCPIQAGGKATANSSRGIFQKNSQGKIQQNLRRISVLP